MQHSLSEVFCKELHDIEYSECFSAARLLLGYVLDGAENGPSF